MHPFDRYQRFCREVSDRPNQGERQITHYVGDRCPGGHRTEVTIHESDKEEMEVAHGLATLGSAQTEGTEKPGA